MRIENYRIICMDTIFHTKQYGKQLSELWGNESVLSSAWQKLNCAFPWYVRLIAQSFKQRNAMFHVDGKGRNRMLSKASMCCSPEIWLCAQRLNQEYRCFTWNSTESYCMAMDECVLLWCFIKFYRSVLSKMVSVHALYWLSYNAVMTHRAEIYRIIASHVEQV